MTLGRWSIDDYVLGKVITTPQIEVANFGSPSGDSSYRLGLLPNPPDEGTFPSAPGEVSYAAEGYLVARCPLATSRSNTPTRDRRQGHAPCLSAAQSGELGQMLEVSMGSPRAAQECEGLLGSRLYC